MLRFTRICATDDGRRILLETDRFPAIASLPFGWLITFNATKPPASWGLGQAMDVFTASPDRRTAVTERITPTRLGFITNKWRCSRGDPTGRARHPRPHRRPTDERIRLHDRAAPAEAPAPQATGHST